MKRTLSRRSAIAYLAVSMLATACGGTQASTNTTSGSKAPGGAAPGGPGGPGGPPPGGASSASNLKLVGTYTLSGGTVSLSNKTYTASANDTSGILVSKSGNLTLTNVIVNTTGKSSSSDNSSFYGLNAPVLTTSGSTLKMTGCSVNSSGSGANAVYSTGTGTKVTISNSTLKAAGEFAHGVMATQGGVLTAINVNITTLGTHSAAVATDRGGGTISVSGGILKTSGKFSPGLYSTGTITVTGVQSISSAAGTAVVEGSNSINVINSSLVSTGIDNGGVMLYQSFSGDAQGTHSTFTMSGGLLSAAGGPLFYVTNATGNINLTGVKLTATSGILLNASSNDQWGTKGSNGGTANLMTTEQTLVGNLVADSISSITATLQKGSSLTGSINSTNTAKEVNLTLDATSKWTVTSTSYLTTLTNTGGISGSTITNIIGNGHTVYYKASANSALGGKTYTLMNGGTLAPR